MRASGQINSNFQFRVIDTAMRIMVIMVEVVIMVEMVILVVMVIMVAMVIMANEVIIVTFRVAQFVATWQPGCEKMERK